MESIQPRHPDPDPKVCTSFRHIQRYSNTDFFIFTDHIYIYLFADASEAEYGALAYFRACNDTGNISKRLLYSKACIARLMATYKRQQTLLCLKLYAAVLVAEGAKRAKDYLNIKLDVIYLWSDSEIVLKWINTTTSSFQMVVANRVSQIQITTTSELWRQITSTDSPAVILSRGCTPSQLQDSKHWYSGPPFLAQNPNLGQNSYLQE